MLRSLLNFLVVAVIAYALYLALLFLQQRQLMFPGAGMRWDDSAAWWPPRAQDLRIPASFGQVRGVLLPAHGAAPTAPAALYFHGNAETVEQNLPLLAGVAALGVHVLLLEYPGYAGADGKPTRETLNEMARLGHDWLAARPEVDAARIVAIGRSVGSGPAIQLADERPVRALVLLAGFTSVADLARRMGAPAFLIRDRFDNLARIGGFDGPVLLFHGRRDRIIPYAHGRRLAAAHPRAELVTLDCGHNDCPYFDAAFLARLRDFLMAEGVLDADIPGAQRTGDSSHM
ncbi:alpha/beta hydrolase [Rehaibacterium terrae]|jgi:pimeloyl-ACP methyl ester carboxylesterase|uniref:Alpha/beta hydrolase n=1 Tax=Rehaibacterium terrae TaxID=1341696 RepID=A0A7W7XZM4_9GAMM|nr:alpha/beta hydrolase [Rehaibacterium terrae]MBB5015381.1 hypothetical protein [Rehaibacterium terrae]